METKIHAHEPSTLDIGCSNGLSRTRAVASSPNYLSFAPRPVPKNGQCFDSDGPGTLSSAGARHDNDFASIKDIRILPTTDEVLCMRPPYMPHKNFNKPHFLERGPERLIDTLFRQLRHDNIERLKDCVYAAAQKLCAMEVPPQEYDPCQETQAGNRYYMYWGAELEDLRFDDRKGLFLQFSYNCPKPMRGRKMFRSGRFEKGMLMAVVGLDDDDVSLSTTFFEVLLPQCTESMESRGGNGVRAAVQLLFAQKDCEEDITRMLLYSQKLRSGRFVLVEFPKHLLNGFYPILKRMQELSGDDLGLTRYFAPRNADEENLGPLPPCYACRSTSVLDCNSLKAKSEAATAFPKYSLRNLVRDKKRFLDIVKSETTLDEGQASAFVESFSNELAFVQGPPGTGKSFLGVALTKAILAAGESGEKPILVVCMTNHALDSFLKDLIDHGVTDVARIGTGSKEDWTAKYNLKSLARSTARTEKEQKDVSKILHDVRRLSADGMDICDSVSNPDRIGWFTVAEHLKANKRYHHILKQLVITPTPGDRLHKSGLAKRASGFPYVFWSAGGDLKVFDESLAQEFSAFLGQNDPDGMKSIDNAKIIGSVLREIVSRAYDNSQTAGEENIWKLSLAERKALISKWAKEIDQKAISREILRIHFEHQDAVRQLELNRQSTDVRCLLKQKVIGMTTTACASKWDLLKQLDLKVVICEEAGEVMEAHTLCTLFQSLEHAVFIGDPLQLRPQIDERSLSLETKAGSQYRLDESLFERLMSDDSGIRKLPYAQLNVQRRMHPDISALVRRTLYPALTDHPSTHSHANIGGLSHRAYWFDHRYPESKAPAASGATKSFCNNFEVQMVYGLVRYLINTNSYARGDIAVLTPYNGQLAELVKCLHGMTNLYLSDKDKESLVDGGLLDEEDLEKNDRVDVDMLDMLRVSTIDNFQGEEAKIIILTTVRSNAENSPGFMRTDNRINVACSRARDGFFIFGNSQCLEVVPMWNSIIKIFKESARFGPSLAVTPCSREMKHCDTVFEIKEPSDFDKIPLCEAICGGRLPCGHSCSEKCHPSEFHGTGQVKCTEVCNKTHPECGHPCQKRCGEDCGSCTHKQATTELDCGHIGVVTCDKDYWGATLQCDVIVSQTSLKCGHTLSVKCDDKDKELFCSEDCKSLLACGHVCRGKCAASSAMVPILVRPVKNHAGNAASTADVRRNAVIPVIRVHKS
ncbi:hypothetical protein DTO280E4_8712 [Paecilomyces variotii]|nr:hypothetical protein DTO280E4_8712 [Paecilomyces variotii]